MLSFLEQFFADAKAKKDVSPIFIAEIGANHDGDFNKAKDMLENLASQGVKIIKFQIYTADKLVADYDRIISYGPPGNMHRESIGKMFDRFSLSKENYKKLHDIGNDLNVDIIASVFSVEDVDFLKSIGSPAVKIAASDVNNIPLLKKAAKSRLPVILSLGKCSLSESDYAVEILGTNGCQNLCLMHCVSKYPAPITSMNLKTIPLIKKIFPKAIVGISDHSIGNESAIAAVSLGAQIVEKHITYDKSAKGPDHWFSMEIKEVPSFVKSLENTFLALGEAKLGVLKCEIEEKKFSTSSLTLNEDIKSGEILTKNHIKIVRPGIGISPKFIDDIVGLKVTKMYSKNSPIIWKMFKEN